MIIKNYFLLFGAILFCAGLWVLTSQTDNKQQTKNLHSGAYESLSFLGSARSFPNAELPNEGYYAAFNQMQKNTELQAKLTTAPWESMGPHNRAGRTLSMAINPQNSNTVYVGSASGGLWRSYSRGSGVEAWERIETGFPALAISTIAFAPGDSSTIYIGTGEVYNVFAAGTGNAYRSTRGSFGIGILKSTDGGATWDFSLDWTSRQTEGIWSVKVFPSDPNLLWAATTDGTYKSTDAGANWTKIHDVILATSILIHPDDPDKLVVACGNFGTPGYGIYYTENGGQNWTKKGSPLPNSYNGKTLLAMAPSQPNTIYASIGNGFGFNDGASWLCRSDDFGVTWTVKNSTDYSKWQGWYSHDVAVHPTNPEELIVIGIDVWKSTDGGENLVQQSLGGIGENNPEIGSPGIEPKFVHSDCHVVIYDTQNPSTLYIGDDGGVHRSDDGGSVFSAANGHLQTTQFYNGFSNSVQDSLKCMGGLQDNGTNTLTGEKRWGVIFGGDGSWTAIDPNNDNVMFVSYQNLRIQRATDGGTFFNDISPPAFSEAVAFIAPYVITPTQFDENVVIYAGGSSVYLSTDSGDNWSVTNSGVPLDGNPVLSMAVAHNDPFTVYAATAPSNATRSGVFATLDGGINWTNITQNLPNAYPMDIAMDPSNSARAYIVYSGFGNPHVFKTDNNGEDWIDISEGLADVPTNAVVVDPLFPNNVYVGNDLGIFASVDYGESWTAYQDGLPAAIMVFDLTISPSNRKLRIASHGNGVYQRDLLEMTPVASNELAKKDFAVQIWPNPAPDVVRIAVDLPEVKKVTVELMDGLGRVLQKEEGRGTFELPVDQLANGIYFCKIQVDEKQVIKKLEILH